MHDIRWIRENAAAFDQALLNRGAEALSGTLFALDDARRKAIADNQTAQERRNALSREIGQAMGRKDLAAAEALKAEVARLKETGPALEAAEREAAQALHDALAAIPNIPQADVPLGKDEHGNVVRHVHGEKPVLWGAESNQPAREHWELGEALGLMDFEAAARMSGSRFVVLKSGLARLERAIGQFFLDTHTTGHGYTEVNPPLLVRDEPCSARRNCRVSVRISFGWRRTLARAHCRGPLTNLVRESILAEAELPLRLTALTPCFARKRGLRARHQGHAAQHQFNKVELVSITTPERSNDEHERMLACAETVLKKLAALPTMVLCTGDMGFASTKTYDIEVWLPGQKAYREISSCSNCGDFQARRMRAQYRPTEAGKGGLPHVHTLNGSGVAVGRALIAVMENYQNPDGSITVPDVLLPYMGGVTRIARS